MDKFSKDNYLFSSSTSSAYLIIFLDITLAVLGNDRIAAVLLRTSILIKEASSKQDIDANVVIDTVSKLSFTQSLIFSICS